MTGQYLIGGLVGALLASAFAPAQPSRVEIQRELNELVIEAANDASVAPIPVTANGRTHATLYDSFMLGIISYRARVATGGKPTADGAPLAMPMLVVVAHAVECDGRRNLPQESRITVAGRPSPVPPMQLPKGAQVIRGVELPEGALVTTFPELPLRDAALEIDYADTTCLGASKIVSARIAQTPVRPMRFPIVVKLPDGAADLPSPTVVRVRVTVDRNGRSRFASLADGPPALEAAAVAAIVEVPFEPARLNGAARHMMVIMPVTFTATGEPPPRAAAPAPVAATNPTATISTPDIPGLAPGSTKCAVSDDETYGFSIANPIKVGGGAFDGPARERTYLRALRGSSGEGINARRVGSVHGPDGTILDLYEVGYRGLQKPVRVYLDEYHFDELKAPKGFVCGNPIGLTAPTTPSGATPAPGAPAGPAPASPSSPVLTSPDVRDLTAASSRCAIASDDTDGVSAANPIRIGGGPAQGAAREAQYLGALRGPAGQGLRYRRVASILGPDRSTVVGVYEISYSGLPAPVLVYFDRSQLAELAAPKGFTCAVPFDIKAPSPTR